MTAPEIASIPTIKQEKCLNMIDLSSTTNGCWALTCKSNEQTSCLSASPGRGGCASIREHGLGIKNPVWRDIRPDTARRIVPDVYFF
jgi:hypothetical protein